MFKNMKIRSRILWAFISIGCIRILLVGGIVGYKVEKTFYDSTLSTVGILNDHHNERIAQFLSRVRNRAIDFSSDRSISNTIDQIISASGTSVLDLHRYLVESKMSLDPSIVGINILDLNGDIVASSSLEEIGRNESEDFYYTEGIDMNYGESIECIKKI